MPVVEPPPKGDIPAKTKLVYWVQGLFMFALPTTTRTEHVDEQGW